MGPTYVNPTAGSGFDLSGLAFSRVLGLERQNLFYESLSSFLLLVVV